MTTELLKFKRQLRDHFNKNINTWAALKKVAQATDFNQPKEKPLRRCNYVKD